MNSVHNFVVAVAVAFVVCGNQVSAQVANGTDVVEAYTGNHKCYECNSHPNKQGEACNDPIDKTKIKLVSCPSEICYKYDQNVEHDIKQINRGCAAEMEPVIEQKKKGEDGCVYSTGTKLVQTEICNCKKSECNGAVGVQSTAMAVVTSCLLAVLAKMSL